MVDDIVLHTFPVLDESNLHNIEELFCNMMNRHRDGRLDPEELDWFDAANSWYISLAQG